jgi:hypothetical protein
MAILPPYQFGDNPAWWAQGESTWWSSNREWAHRPTERLTFIRMALKNWALRDGHYWDWLNDIEQQLHLTDLWLVQYLPALKNARQRAEWVHYTLYPHLSAHDIISVWDMIDVVLCEYAYQKVSLHGIMRELWGVDGGD